MANPSVKPFHDAATGSWQYVIHDPGTMRGATIDVVMDYDANAGAITAKSAEKVLKHIEDTGIQIDWILDTHPHADHFMAASWLKQRLNAPIAIGEKVTDVQELWKEIYNLPEDFPTDGAQWDRLLADGETFKVGDIEVEVMFSPGHTLASITYLAGDAAFVHDTLMMPDSGTSRADFPGGSSGDLYETLQKILALPEETRLFVGHDYCKGGRDPLCEASVAQQKAENIHLKDNPDEATFRKRRDERDARLPLPDRMLAALQYNIRAGQTPDPEDNGRSYLKIPLDYFKPRKN